MTDATTLPDDDHAETDLGMAAAVTDRGRRHRRNEDAYAVAVEGDRAAVVVCDGVSSSANPDQASAAAAAAAADALRPSLTGPAQPDPAAVTDVLRAAVSAAGSAVVGVPGDEPGGHPAAPSTTIVVALVEPGRVAVASVGDSRAYWLTPEPDEQEEPGDASRRLTVDDSLAEMAIKQGVPPEAAYRLPQAHVITRWLGAGAREGEEPEVGVFTTERGGLLLVCTDGLWNYFEPPEHLASLITEHGGTTPIEMARSLVDAANAAGGGDNITVAVVAVPPAA
ncbi:protein phosphatase 2C domain-containing protein [Acidiferrimicrobium sp. IK]|uniref:PP2C family protein-serine/threonine phosphatase n=1 Tax=Acidiferrimicrobium sp. IK TaxID=2871700 RepID=UPI0021CB5C6B|nr:protein phosphatase 2C domain-containing protein [Acidiferrimicrobium sp. IK]MCU4182974.1 protein phosphatase 2C domain-containing protein [Acidiferrimicrobium sp. IK]